MKKNIIIVNLMGKQIEFTIEHDSFEFKVVYGSQILASGYIKGVQPIFTERAREIALFEASLEKLVSKTLKKG